MSIEPETETQAPHGTVWALTVVAEAEVIKAEDLEEGDTP